MARLESGPWESAVPTSQRTQKARLARLGRDLLTVGAAVEGTPARDPLLLVGFPVAQHEGTGFLPVVVLGPAW